MRTTRGSGWLEQFLARQRARVALRALPASVRDGRVLDVGCGQRGWLLERLPAREREGVDRLCEPTERTVGWNGATARIRLQPVDLTQGSLPFADGWFDAVTMLAVLEHLPRASAERTLREIHRVLKPGGRCILTTPSHGTEELLHGLASLGLVSHEEIEEHHRHFTLAELREVLRQAGFPVAGIRCGRFELGMNLWLVATKTDGVRT